MFGKQRVISLSIDSTDTKVVSANDGIIERWDSIPIPSDFMGNGYIADAVTFGQVLRDSLDEREMAKGKFVCAHSALGATSRVLKLPKVNPKQLQAIVTREARRLTEEAADKYYLYWRGLSSSDQHLRVYVLLIPHRPVRAFLKTLESAGLKPAFVDLKPMAVMRTVNQENAIIANVDSNSVDVVIVVNGVPMTMRSSHHTDTESASVDDTARVSQELVQAMSSFNDSHRATPLPRDLPVYVTGAAAEDVSSHLGLSAAVSRPIGQLKPPLPCPTGLPVADYAVNLGLLIRAS